MSGTGLKVVGGTDVDPVEETVLPEIAAEANPGLERASEESTKAFRLFAALSQKLRGPNGEAPGIDSTVLDYYDGDVDAAAEACGIDLTVDQ